MSLIASRWRGWLAFAGLGSALAFGYRGDWALASAVAALVLLRVGWRATRWVRGEFAATRTALRAFDEMAHVAASYSRVKR